MEILERILDGRIAYAVEPSNTPILPDAIQNCFISKDAGDSDSDWQCLDENYEIEKEQEAATDIFVALGTEERRVGSGSRASVKKQARRQRLAEFAGEDG